MKNRKIGSKSRGLTRAGKIRAKNKTAGERNLSETLGITVLFGGSRSKRVEGSRAVFGGGGPNRSKPFGRVQIGVQKGPKRGPRGVKIGQNRIIQSPLRGGGLGPLSGGQTSLRERVISIEMTKVNTYEDQSSVSTLGF